MSQADLPADAPRPLRPKPRARRHALALALSLVLLVVLFVVAEGVARLAGKRPRPQNVNGYFFVADPKLGWRNRANGRYEFEGPGSLVTTGSRGERNGVRSSADPTGPTVLFVGDSTTFCAEVNDDESGPSEVAKLLDPKLAPFVVNAGVRAYGTLQAVRMAEEWLARSPVKVVVYTYADNDYVENVNPIVYLPCWAPQAVWKDDKLSIVEPPEPASGWGESLEDDTLLRWDKRTLLRLARHSALAHFALENVSLPVPRKTLEDGATGPIGTPGQWERAKAWAGEHHADDAIRALLTELADACRARSARLLVTRFTTHPEREDYPLPLSWPRLDRPPIAWTGLAGRPDFAVSLGDAFLGEPTTYRARMKGGTFDAHYGPLGTKTYAKALAPTIEELLRAK